MFCYIMMLAVFLCELRSFFEAQMNSSLTLDYEDDSNFQINFDIDMYDIECRNLDILVIDQQGQEPIRSVQKTYRLSDLNKAGRYQAVHRVRDSALANDAETDEELEHKRLATQLEKTDGKQELDSDWADSHDGFKHQSFEHVIQYHDYTLINFFAEWCSHCRQFSPMWKELATKIGQMQYTVAQNHKLHVHPIKLNCVDFQQICRDQGIDAFPTIRLYKSDGTFSRFNGHRSEAGIENWVAMILEQQHQSVGGADSTWKRHHEESEMGCNVLGTLIVPKTPGHLELFAGGGDQNLVASMTNVSHKIKHLSFSEPRGGYKGPKRRRVPPEAKRFEVPMNNRHFSTRAFHEAWEHHLKVVRTVTHAGNTYQFSHYSRTSQLNRSEIPQARFYYDLEPFALEIRYEHKRWYDLSTSLLAILGGLFVSMRLGTMAVLTAMGSGPRSRRSNGLLS